MKHFARIHFPIQHAFTFFVTAFCFITLTSGAGTRKEKVIQIKLDKILNARSVTTLTKGKLVTWTKGIDGNGEADGYLTLSASFFKGDKSPKALSDNPLYPANDEHPGILLHYSNDDGVSNQTVAVSGAGSFGFDVPKKQYSKLFLAFGSSEGASKISIKLQYADGTESKSVEIPDYYLDLQSKDRNMCYLVHDLAKWGKQNNMTESNHHNIDLLDIQPDPTRILTRIDVEKSAGGYLVFWAATGVTAN